ncbi:MAG: substrate-binding periplasmic protein [Bdellovibrionia bacterium]
MKLGDSIAVIFRFLLIFLVVLSGAQTFAKVRELKTAVQDNSPSKFSSRNNNSSGICNEILDLIASRLGDIKINGRTNGVSLGRIETMLEKSEIDFAVCLLQSEQRKKKFQFIKVPLYSVNYVLMVKAEDDVNIANLMDISKIQGKNTVLVHRGSVLAESLRQLPIKMNDSVRTQEQIVKMMEAGRARFLYAQDMELLSYFNDKNIAKKFRILPQSFFKDYQYVAVTNTLDPTIKVKLEQILLDLEKQGILKALEAKYRKFSADGL